MQWSVVSSLLCFPSWRHLAPNMPICDKWQNGSSKACLCSNFASKRGTGASDACWLNHGDCLQACHFISDTGLDKTGYSRRQWIQPQTPENTLLCVWPRRLPQHSGKMEQESAADNGFWGRKHHEGALPVSSCLGFHVVCVNWPTVCCPRVLAEARCRFQWGELEGKLDTVKIGSSHYNLWGLGKLMVISLEREFLSPVQLI